MNLLRIENPPTYWAVQAEIRTREDQRALDDFNSVHEFTDPESGIDAARERTELKASCDEHLREAVYWRGQFLKG